MARGSVIPWLLFFTAELLQFCIGPVYGVAGSADWRQLGRMAAEQLKHRNFQQAENCYRQALSSLVQQNPSAEEQFDLQLLLVETYVEAGRYEEARAVLQNLQSTFDSHKFVDPTLPVRFFRRRAHLEQATGLLKEAVADNAAILTILRHYFDRDSTIIIENVDRTLYSTILAKDWQTATKILSDWHAELKSGKLPPRLCGDVRTVLAYMHHDSQELLRKGAFEQSFDIMQMLEKIESGPTQVIADWSNYIQVCVHGKNKQILGRSIVALENALTAFHASDSDSDGRRIELRGYFQLSQAYSQLAQTDVALKHLKMVRMLAKRAGNDLSALESFNICKSALKAAEELMRKGDCSDLVIETLNDCGKSANTITSAEQRSTRLGEKWRVLSVQCQLQLIKCYRKRKEWNKLEQLCSSVPENNELHIADYKLRLARIHSVVAESYVSDRQPSGALKHIATAYRLLHGEPHSEQYNAVVEKLNRLEKQIMSDSSRSTAPMVTNIK